MWNMERRIKVERFTRRKKYDVEEGGEEKEVHNEDYDYVEEGEQDGYEGKEGRKGRYEAEIDGKNLTPTRFMCPEMGGKGLLLGKKRTPLHSDISTNPHCRNFTISPFKLLYHFNISVVLQFHHFTI